MADYIDRNELVGNLDRFAPEHLTPLVRNLIAKQPTADVVEVVRCKDCKKFIEKGEEYILNDVFGICEKSRTGLFDDGEEVYGNDFCAYGERRDT